MAKPRTKTPEQLAELDAKRRVALKKGSMGRLRELLESHTDPETGAGVVILNYHRSSTRIDLEAHFFRPRQTRIPFARHDIASNHQRIGALDWLRRLIDEEAAAKVAPHDLTEGEVLCDDWGYSCRDPRFYQVVGIPHPRKVSLIRLADEIISGDFQTGLRMPILPPQPNPDSKPFTALVSMETGKPYVQLGTLSHCTRWGGKPEAITSD